MAPKRITIKLLVDEKKNRVVFAESDSDFVDVLLSFLTIPVGTVVRLCGKESNLGCMDSLYKSVESLNVRHLQSEACKSILLRPRNAWRVNLDTLPVNIVEKNYNYEYICSTRAACIQKGYCTVGTVPNAYCGCGKMMMNMKAIVDVPAGETFVKGNLRFMITDELKVTLLTTQMNLALLRELRINDLASLKEETVEVGADEVLGLLKRSLLSQTPLSDVFLLKRKDHNMTSLNSTSKLQGAHRKEQCGHDPQRKMVVNVLLNRGTNKVLYVETGEAFVDFLFSFLTFPLGSIAKVLGNRDQNSSDVGCLHNLYKSAQKLCGGTSGDLLLSEEHKDMLLNPKLPPYHGCKNQLLPIEATLDREINIFECETCFGKWADPSCVKCAHGMGRKKLKVLNPKKINAAAEYSQTDDIEGGFVKSGSSTSPFMITDELHVQRLSPLGAIKRSNAFLGDLVHMTLNFGQEEAMNLLKASLISKTPLSDVFIEKPACAQKIGGS